jgi:hypothetical protein
LLPTAVTRWLVSKLQPRRFEGHLEGTFPAFYDWCRGPSRRQLQRLRGVGFDVVEYRAYYGTPGYYRPLKLRWLDAAMSRVLQRFRVVAMTSYALVVLRKPVSAEAVQPAA